MKTRTTNSAKHAPAAPADQVSSAADGRRDIGRPATDSRILRRWALADLIAAARWRSAFA